MMSSQLREIRVAVTAKAILVLVGLAFGWAVGFLPTWPQVAATGALLAANIGIVTLWQQRFEQPTRIYTLTTAVLVGCSFVLPAWWFGTLTTHLIIGTAAFVIVRPLLPPRWLLSPDAPEAEQG